MREKGADDIRPYTLLSAWSSLIPGTQMTQMQLEQGGHPLYSEDTSPILTDPQIQRAGIHGQNALGRRALKEKRQVNRHGQRLPLAVSDSKAGERANVPAGLISNAQSLLQTATRKPRRHKPFCAFELPIGADASGPSGRLQKSQDSSPLRLCASRRSILKMLAEPSVALVFMTLSGVCPLR